MKIIPIPPKDTYKISLLEKVESVIKRMRWKALFFLNPTAIQQIQPKIEKMSTAN